MQAVPDEEDTYMSQEPVDSAPFDASDALGDSRGKGDSEDIYQALDQPADSSAIVQPPIYDQQDNSEFLLESDICPAIGGASSVMDAFDQGSGGNADWQVGLLNDYLALPDPTFPFTSMAFIRSLDLPTSHGEAGAVELDAAHPDSLGGSVETGMENVQQERQFGTTLDGQYSFTVSPPLLSPSQEESLLSHFERQIRPPASLVGVDPVGWAKIWRCAVKMARERHESVLHAVFALSTLLTASRASIRLGMNRNDHVLFASRLQEAACAAMHVGASHPEWESKNSQALLVSVFLLAWFEVCPPFCSGSSLTLVSDCI